MHIPCLFTLGSAFGNKVLFGLLTNEGIHPVRVVANDKVRTLHAPKPAPVPPTLDLLLMGRECEEFLAEQDVLEGLFLAMATDMSNAVRSQMSRKAQGIDGRYKKRNAEVRLINLLMKDRT